MEIPISIRRVELSDLPQIYQLKQLDTNPQGISHQENYEERIRNHTDTFLLVTLNEEVLGYILGTEIADAYETGADNDLMIPGIELSNFILIRSLTIDPKYYGQGFGTLLLAALKEVVCQFEKKGICVYCPEDLVGYYEMNGFSDEEMLDFPLEGRSIFVMIWRNPYLQEKV